ncbi:MAG: DUF3883 domain-containing protein [Verrucomicrobia bacterium]|nr:DUF3883 domain-containing protein [Verrucomicrobiota bacterium]
MMRLDELHAGMKLNGVLPGKAVTVKSVRAFGANAVEITYSDSGGTPGSQLIFKDREQDLEEVGESRRFGLTSDAELFRLTAEAMRIHLGYLFDPIIAVNTSDVDPLPHQISAVYETMLGRQPLRFLLADDPGAGKTIMAGLLVKELLIRGDVAKCLIVAPGNLVEQWQDELDQRFNLPFEIMTNEGIESARSGNWFLEHDLCLCRLDKLSRNEDLQSKIAAVDWDLVIVDEAHKMSASYFGSEIKYTKRYRLGQLLSEHTRQLVLLTATPHNGKEEDFQLFMALLDGDRFEGKLRDGAHTVDYSDLMRRMVKEQLVTMEGKPLFPERFAYTLNFDMSALEARLYAEVTDYVRNEFNRADQLEKGRKGTVGFALTILQRRLASSPEAIYQSIRRRRERLEERLREEQTLKRGAEARLNHVGDMPALDIDDLDDFDEIPESEAEMKEEQVVDLATAAQTIVELDAEIDILQNLEALALRVRRSGDDTKWRKVAEALNDNALMFDRSGNRRKLVIFTEHRDTLNYLRSRLSTMLGNPNAIVVIHGQTPREQRRAMQEAFTGDPDVLVLLATDAAGEGINLQRAHLMINYDLPWNPNRLEQRFGRIHRIGQTEVCHLWNLVAANTREGEVYLRLLEKIDKEREALGGAVFDVLGQVFRSVTLKDLLIEAIRRGEDPAVKERLNRIIDSELDEKHLKELIADRALAHEGLDDARVQHIRETMERAKARKLQPHFIESFFIAAFEQFGGKLLQREQDRFEITHVPAEIRNRDRLIGRSAPVLKSYERVTFKKEAIRVEGKPPAVLVAPGHPLLDAVIDLLLERNRDKLTDGAILVDPNDPGVVPRLLVFLESTITDGRPGGRELSTGRMISRRLQFVEISPNGEQHIAGHAPYLDYEAPTPEQRAQAAELLDAPWLTRNIEDKAVENAVEHLIPEHLNEVRTRREAHVRKTMEQVKDRLTREIVYWDHRANDLELKERSGKSRSRLNSTNARQRADTLSERLNRRMTELELEKSIVPLPPTITGAALIVPVGYFDQQQDTHQARESRPMYGRDNKASEELAMQAVMHYERDQGRSPRDVSQENRGYDIESADPDSGDLLFIEVKGRAAGADTVTITRNELLTALNCPQNFILAIVMIENGRANAPIYVREPFREGLAFNSASLNLDLRKVLS